MSHYYTRDGEARHHYQHPDSGELKPTSPSVALKHGWAPSVTTVCHAFGNKALQTWEGKEKSKLCFHNPCRPGEMLADYVQRIDHLFRQQSARVLDFGTDLHDACQKFVDAFHEAGSEMTRGEINAMVSRLPVKQDCYDHAMEFAYWYGDNFKRFEGCIYDIKSQGGESKDKMYAYLEHHLQLAAYGKALLDRGQQSLSDPLTEHRVVNETYGYAGTVDYCWPQHWTELGGIQLINIYVSRDVPGVIRMHRWTKKNNDRAWQMFKATLKRWKLEHGDVCEVWNQEQQEVAA